MKLHLFIWVSSGVLCLWLAIVEYGQQPMPSEAWCLAVCLLIGVALAGLFTEESKQ